MALKDVIGTSTDNLRVNVQDGAFIVFGFLLDENGYLTNGFSVPSHSVAEEIPREEKFQRLVNLLFPEAESDDELNAICYVNLFPDSKDSMDLQAEYEELQIVKRFDPTIFREYYQGRIEHILEPSPRNPNRKAMMQLFLDKMDTIVSNRNLFYFAMKEFVDYANVKATKDIQKYFSLIEKKLDLKSAETRS